MTVSPDNDAAASRVLLLVTTQRDATITIRLLSEAGLTGEACGNITSLGREIKRGAAALLMTEETVALAGIKVLASLIRSEDGLDLPTVVLTHGGPRSAAASALMAELQNITILERPAPISSIISAIRAAVRVRVRQRELLQQMARIRELQTQLTVALEASDLGTFHCEIPLGRILWNDACKRHFWLPSDAIIDIDLFYSILHPADREKTRQAIEACVHRGLKYDIEYRTVSPRGEIRWVRATGQTPRSADGTPLFFSGTTQDVSVRKEFDAERTRLLESERAARMVGERANQLKDEFLATLGHELRTPLNAIVGWIEILKIEATNPTVVAEGISVIERNVWAQAQLIDDLLDVSRIISGKVRLEIKPLDIVAVLKAASETVSPAAAAKRIHLESTIEPNVPAISGDFGRLQQVVWNLLSNAIKFSPEDSRVRVSVRQVDSLLEIAVADDGEGIDAAFLPHIFERFRQADGSHSRRHGGLGLGLSIVKTLVEMHGGSISAQSEGKGRGSLFCIQIPLRFAGTKAGEAPASPTPANSGPRTHWDLSKHRILVVDDEPDARQVMRRLLENCGATVVVVGSADEGKQQITAFAPHLILSDIGMPGKDGYQFIREVRKDGVTTPAIALTAFAREEDRAHSLAAGYQHHLAKPLNSSELLALVAQMVG